MVTHLQQLQHKAMMEDQDLHQLVQALVVAVEQVQLAEEEITHPQLEEMVV
tara:strand:- start:251 stop:403 length:153 start_codon:yes stop_codon:yes gene_type:complete